MEGRKKKNKGRKIALIAFAAVFVILYVYIYLIPKVPGMFTDTYIAEYGTLSVGIEAEFLTVRNEQVFQAASYGEVVRKAEAGELKRGGSTVVTVGGTSVKSKESGIVSYCYDGLESELTPENVGAVSPEMIGAIASDSETYALKECSQGSVSPGEPVFKIIDNSKWYLVMWLSKADAEMLKKGRQVTVVLPDGTEFPMTAEQLNRSGDLTQAVLSCDRDYPALDALRRGKAGIITTERSGIILETSSIATLDGKQGVYVINKLGRTVFKEIQVIASSGDKTVVEKNYFQDENGSTVSTVKTYDTVKRIKNPVEEPEGEENAD